MKRRITVVLMAMCGLMLAASVAQAQFNYIFFAGTGNRLTGSFSSLNFTHRTGTQWGASFDQRLINLGFTFQFNGVNYTQVRAYHNGVLVMGSGSLSDPTSNALNGQSVPIVAGLWDAMRVTDNLQWTSGGTCSPSVIESAT